MMGYLIARKMGAVYMRYIVTILSSNQTLGHKLTTEVCFYVAQL